MKKAAQIIATFGNLANIIDQLCNNDQHEETLSNGRTYCLEDFDLDTVNNNNETYWDTRCESGINQ